MGEINLTKTLTPEWKDTKDKMEKATGVNIKDCYQCGKCSAGCPVAFAMDLTPREVLRHLQLGRWEEVLNSKTVWLCASCVTCYTRCPQEVDIPSLMDYIRQEAKARGIIPERDINRFNDIFLKNLYWFGRSHEVSLMALYNFTTGHIMQDVITAPHLYFSGKITILPHRVKDREAMRKIITKCLDDEQGGVNAND